ncbi:IMportin Beta family member (imb-2) [Angomonas deanei]|nr:IMportin Beta family member (imb-2) [Angomonas deanei]|eukprot:EPY35049.1 IMportin Beta family member (imb-2) [Angomonas deanei]
MAVLENAGEAVDNPQQCYSHYVMQSGIVQVIEACFLNLQQPVSKSISVTCVKVLTLSLIFYDAIDNNLFNRMADLMSQVLASSDDHSGRDEELRMAATDFFTVAPNIPKFYSLALTAVLKVIPIVIRSMVLSDMEMAGLQANKEDWQVPDKEEDIRPRHYGARQQQMHDDGEDEDDDGEVENNTLRSTSGSMLDTLSSCYGEAVLMPVLQEVDKMMQPNAPWREFEASMVAFGAVVDGCLEALTPYLPSITTRLLGVLEDPNSHFLVVSICLWACSKISSFILTDETMTRRFLVNGILAKMQSPSKYTQSYATDALQTFLQANQDVGANLGPYLGTILETWAQCLRGYQLKNKVSLLDALDIICTDLGEQIKQDSNMSQALLAAMGELWTATDNESMFIFPLFSSMSRVCAALGPHVESMVQVILTRGLEVLQSNLTERQQALASDGDPPEEEFITTSCDLICGVFEAMGSAMAPFVEGNTVLTQMMLFMLQDPSAEIRCSGFGLASEMCKSSPTVIQQVLPDFMQAVLSNLSNIDESTYYVASNVAWALCQLVQNQMDINNLPTFQSIPQGVQAFAALVRILTSDGVSADMRNMAENICFFIGIAVYTAGPELAEQAQCPPSAFAGRFLEYMRNVKEMECREEAVNGFLLLARQDPSCVVPHLSLFFDLACTLGGADAETKRTVKDIFQEVRSKQPQAWQQLSGYSAPGKRKLYEIFGVQS